MYCPECGNNAGDARFCADCGADLRDLGGQPRCPTCGTEVTGGRFCPECGGQLEAAVPAPRPRTSRRATQGRTPAPTRQVRTPQRARTARRAAARTSAPTRSAAGRRGPSAALLWGGAAAAVIIAVLAVVLTSGGAGNASGVGVSGAQSVPSVSADTSGSYAELVQRANGLYDQGAAAFKANDAERGSAYFRAAARVYAAAWKRQDTDPNVGTDYATSLFYSGQIQPAVKQVDRVLARSPDFQTAWFNKGNYLAEKASQAGANGDAGAAQTAYEEARAAYQKAISIDASSQVGSQAKQQLGQLPQ